MYLGYLVVESRRPCRMSASPCPSASLVAGELLLHPLALLPRLMESRLVQVVEVIGRQALRSRSIAHHGSTSRIAAKKRTFHRTPGARIPGRWAGRCAGDLFAVLDAGSPLELGDTAVSVRQLRRRGGGELRKVGVRDQKKRREEAEAEERGGWGDRWRHLGEAARGRPLSPRRSPAVG